MAFWYRMKQSQLKNLSNHLKRCYFQTQAPCSLNNTSPHTKIWVVDSPSLFLHKTQFQIANNVRFYAAPVQVKQKQEDKDSTGPRLNEQITSQYVRLVTDEGHGIVSRHEALERARTLKLDLVEVQRTAKPPVCKIMDYHKEKYVQQIKEKDRSKSKSEATLRKGDYKEVRFTGKIEQKDLQMKADMVKRLMERGYRVKCMAMGTEDQDLGGLLSRLSALIDDFCIVESGPRVEKKQAYVIVRHVKFGPSKKGSSKKATSSTKVPKVSVSPQIINPSAQIPLQFDEILDGAESGLETEDDILYEEAATSPSFKTLDEDLVENKSTWSVSNASDDFDKVFDFRNDVASPEMPSSPANSFSKVSSMIPTLDFTKTPLNSPSSAEAPLGIDNRYKREPRNKMNVNGPDMRDSARLKPQFPNPRGHLQFDLSTSSPSRETKHVEMEGSMFKNVKLPADEFPKREPSQSPSPSFGLFTAPEPNSINGKQSGPAVVVNRYKKTANPSRGTESQAKVQR